MQETTYDTSRPFSTDDARQIADRCNLRFDDDLTDDLNFAHAVLFKLFAESAEGADAANHARRQRRRCFKSAELGATKLLEALDEMRSRDLKVLACWERRLNRDAQLDHEAIVRDLTILKASLQGAIGALSHRERGAPSKYPGFDTAVRRLADAFETRSGDEARVYYRPELESYETTFMAFLELFLAKSSGPEKYYPKTAIARGKAVERILRSR